MHSNIGGIHTNGPTLSNTTTHYILHTPITTTSTTIYSVPQGTLLQLFLFLSRVRKLRKLFLKTFQINFPRQTFRLGLSTRRGRQDGSEGVLSCVPKDLRKSFIFERDCRVELLDIYTILKNYQKILQLRLI